MFRRTVNNTAMRLLGVLGLTHLFQAAVPPIAVEAMNRQPHGGSRWGRNVQTHTSRKRDFNRAVKFALETGSARVPTPISVARKAHLGTLTIPGGRRGLQVKRERLPSGKWHARITA